MINLSKKSQEILENMPIDNVEMMDVTQERKDFIFDLVKEKLNNDSTSLLESEEPPSPVKKKLKLSYLIAATIMTFLLIGAGYVTSKYFSKQHIPTHMEELDVIKDYPELVVDAPEFADKSNPQSSDVPIIEVEKPIYRNREQIFKGKAPGEIFSAEIHESGSDYKEMAVGVTGDAINRLYYTSEDGLTNMETKVNESRAISTQEMLDHMIADGKFIVTLENPKYKPLSYTDSGNIKELRYLTENDSLIQIFLTCADGPSEMPEDVYNNAVPYDFVRNGRTFTLVDHGESVGKMIETFLGDYKTMNVTEISVFCQGATDQQCQEIAENMRFYNESANTILPSDESFFANFPQDIIRNNAKEIASSVEEKATASYEDYVPIWEKENITLYSYEGGRFITVETKDTYQNNEKLFPYQQHTPIVEEAWFPKDQLTQFNVRYEYAKVDSAFYRSNDDTYTFSSVIAKNNYISSPLDAIISVLSSDVHFKPIKIIGLNSPTPMLIGTDETGDYVYSAVKTEENNYLVEILYLPKGILPKELGLI